MEQANGRKYCPGCVADISSALDLEPASIFEKIGADGFFNSNGHSIFVGKLSEFYDETGGVRQVLTLLCDTCGYYIPVKEEN